MDKGSYVFYINRDGGHESGEVLKVFRSGWLLVDFGGNDFRRVKKSNCILQIEEI